MLVYHDLLGFTQHPHHAKVTPKFCKQYAAVGEVITGALRAFREDVESGAFPSRKFSPYRVEGTDADRLVEALRREGTRGRRARRRASSRGGTNGVNERRRVA